MSSQICVDRANRYPRDLGTRFLYRKPFPMQNLGPKDVFLQMLGWKKYILCLRRETDVMILKLRPKLQEEARKVQKPSMPYSGSRQCRSAECKDFDVTFRDETFNLLIWSTFYHRERSAVVCGSLSPEKILYSNRRPKTPYSDEVWGAEGQWLHGNSLATKKVSNSWIGIVQLRTSKGIKFGPSFLGTPQNPGKSGKLSE